MYIYIIYIYLLAIDKLLENIGVEITYIYIHIYIFAFANIGIHIHMYVCMCAYRYIKYICIYYIHECECFKIDIHLYTHIYM
jgi:hypothetical protein